MLDHVHSAIQMYISNLHVEFCINCLMTFYVGVSRGQAGKDGEIMG